MKIYDPRIEIRIIKAIERTDIVPGVGVVVERYGGATGYNLSALLGENTVVQVDKSTREVAGGFSISLADRNTAVLETVYALVEPMDLVDIRFCHDPAEYGGKPPVVMRGLVSQVTRNESITNGDTANGNPSRTVTIAGQDWGNLLNIIQLLYKNNSVLAEEYFIEFKWFHRYFGDAEAKKMRATEFVNLVVSKILNPYMARILQFADGAPVGAKVINAMTPKVSILGLVNPHVVSALSDVTLYEAMKMVLDCGAFNELFVFDAKDGIELIVRPNPFRKPGTTEFIQDGAWAHEIDIDHIDLVSLESTRSDDNVSNYYWVDAPRFPLADNINTKTIAQSSHKDSFITFDYVNSDASYYGIRKMAATVQLMPQAFKPKESRPIPVYSGSDSQKKEVLPADTESVLAWLEWRRRCLLRMNRDNLILETGKMTLRGNEKIKVGTYVNLKREALTASYYAHKVSHTFRPFRDFLTTVEFERGEGFFKRSSMAGPYEAELDRGGA